MIAEVLARLEAIEQRLGLLELDGHRPHIPASQNTRWGSPEELVAELAAEFGPFDLDVCGDEELHVCDVYFSEALDGLKMPWFGRCWCNPPYGEEGLWIHKAVCEVLLGRCERVVFLIPSKTSMGWWEDFVTVYAKVVRFLKGRLQFRGAKSCAPFASAVVVFEKGEVSSQ